MTSPATGPPATGTVPPRRAGTAAGPPESPGHVSSARPCRGPHAPPPPPAWPAPLLPPSSGPDRASCCPSPVAPRGVPVTLAAAPSLPSCPSPSHLPSRREHADARLAPAPQPGEQHLPAPRTRGHQPAHATRGARTWGTRTPPPASRVGRPGTGLSPPPAHAGAGPRRARPARAPSALGRPRPAEGQSSASAAPSPCPGPPRAWWYPAFQSPASRSRVNDEGQRPGLLRGVTTVVAGGRGCVLGVMGPRGGSPRRRRGSACAGRVVRSVSWAGRATWPPAPLSAPAGCAP